MSTVNPATNRTVTDSTCSSVPPGRLANAALANRVPLAPLDHPVVTVNPVPMVSPVPPVMLARMRAKMIRSGRFLSSAPANPSPDLPDPLDPRDHQDQLDQSDPTVVMAIPDPMEPQGLLDLRVLMARPDRRVPTVMTARSSPPKISPLDPPAPVVKTVPRDLPVTAANPEMPDPTERTETTARGEPTANPETLERTALLANPAAPVPRAPAITAHQPVWPPAISRPDVTFYTAVLFTTTIATRSRCR